MIAVSDWALVVQEWHGQYLIVAKGYKSNMLNKLRNKKDGRHWRVARSAKEVGQYIKL